FAVDRPPQSLALRCWSTPLEGYHVGIAPPSYGTCACSLRWAGAMGGDCAVGGSLGLGTGGGASAAGGQRPPVGGVVHIGERVCGGGVISLRHGRRRRCPGRYGRAPEPRRLVGRAVSPPRDRDRWYVAERRLVHVSKRVHRRG